MTSSTNWMAKSVRCAWPVIQAGRFRCVMVSWCWWTKGRQFFPATKKAPRRALFCGRWLAFQRSRQVRLNGSQYGLEAFGVAGNDLTLLQEVVATAEV